MSTKTTLKRIALVAVSALGFGVLSIAPSSGATNFTATFTSPTTLDLAASAVDSGGAASVGVGTITITLGTLDGPLVNNDDTATVTMTSSGAGSNDFLAALSFSKTVSGATSSGIDLDNATTGYNALNNGTVTLDNTADTVILNPTASTFGASSGRVYLNVDTTALEAADSGDIVYFDLTTASGGVTQTFRQLLTLTIGAKQGTNTITPAVASTGVVNLGGSATATRIQPWTNVPANAIAGTTAGFTASGAVTTFTLADVSGTAVADGKVTFSVSAAATGGSVNLVRSSSTVLVATPVKNALAGSLSITYTITVNVASSAAAGNSFSINGFTFTVQPYTPAYSYSTISTPDSGTNSFYYAKAQGGDGIVWAPASATAAYVFRLTVDQYDQNNAAITNAVYAKTVTATLTGKGSLAIATGGSVIKTFTRAAALANLTGSDNIDVWSDGTSGEGTLTIAVDGVTVGTYTFRFYGDVATVEATALRPVGTTSGGTNGQTIGSAATITDNAANGLLNNITTHGGAIRTVNANVTGIAVSAKDSNGWVIPTAAPTVTSSDRTVVSGASRLFIDAGVTDVTSAVKTSAGTFVQHFDYTTVAGSKSGSTSDLVFTVVNSAGTAVSSEKVTIAVGGALASGKLTFDKATYNPGEVATITATGLDAAGNKAADGQDLMAADLSTSLNFTAPASFALVNGTRARVVFAPATSGVWEIEATDASGITYTASATVRNPADEAKSASDAATAAAEAATDAALEAIDAANAATDAANLAAEASDAATVAAEEARDAADSATAAVEALAAEVAEMMASLKAQLTTLAKTVAKIAKKVKA